MRMPVEEIVVDNFACGGGASEGIESALDRPVDFAINHNAKALAVHMANHPRTVHFREDIRTLDPRTVGAGRPIGLGWFSPDCTYHSKARGGKPFRDRNRARRIRGLAWSVTHWAKVRRPRMIMLENVEEFAHWGPLDENGKPDPKRRGQTFRRWHRQLENMGYDADMRELVACQYGAPTSRKRLFVIMRCDGREIIFPEPTHGPGLLPYLTAAQCIDWSIPCPSIFLTREEGRKLGVRRPLAEATMRRIARGVMRYVVNNPRPFIVPVNHGGVGRDDRRTHDIYDPLPTITASCRGSHALVTAFLARHYGGHENDGAPLPQPMFTVTTKDHHALVTSHILKFKGTSPDGQPVTEPLHTVQAGGLHYGDVRAFLCAYYGNDRDGQSLLDPMRTVTTKDRLALVTVHGVDYAIVDIGMRMLTPRELARATSFPDSYILDPEYNGKSLTKTDQVWMIGNAVPPVVAESLVSANISAPQYRRASA